MIPWCSHTGTPRHFHASSTSGTACLINTRTWASILPLQSPNSLILASISPDGDSSPVAAVFFAVLFFISLAPHSDFSPAAPKPVPGWQGISSSRTARPDKPVADRCGSPPAPCADGCPYLWG